MTSFHVMLVDNDEEYKAALTKAFAAAGNFRVSAFTSGDAAHAAAKEDTPDLIVVSDQLPGAPFAAAELFKTDKSMRDIAMMIVTHGVPREVADAHHEVGHRAQDYVTRATTADDFVQRARRHLPLHPAAQTAPPRATGKPADPGTSGGMAGFAVGMHAALSDTPRAKPVTVAAGGDAPASPSTGSAPSASAPARSGGPIGITYSTPASATPASSPAATTAPAAEKSPVITRGDGPAPFKPEELRDVDRIITALRERRRYTEALAALEERAERVVDAKDKVATYETMIAIYRNDLGSESDASDCAKKILSLDPHHASARAMLGASAPAVPAPQAVAPSPVASAPSQTAVTSAVTKSSAHVGTGAWEHHLLLATRRGDQWLLHGLGEEKALTWNELTQLANILGEDGWELVSMAGVGADLAFAFKRRA